MKVFATPNARIDSRLPAKLVDVLLNDHFDWAQREGVDN